MKVLGLTDSLYLLGLPLFQDKSSIIWMVLNLLGLKSYAIVEAL